MFRKLINTVRKNIFQIRPLITLSTGALRYGTTTNINLLKFGGCCATIIASSSTLASCEDQKTMYYRMLGNTGLQVSVLSYGFWATFGVKSDLNDKQGIDMAKECLRVARDAGINLFDNAEVYGNPNGEAERIMGEAISQLQKEDPIKWRRSDLVITTKVEN
jgi:hypothetical protein